MHKHLKYCCCVNVKMNTKIDNAWNCVIIFGNKNKKLEIIVSSVVKIFIIRNNDKNSAVLKII